MTIEHEIHERLTEMPELLVAIAAALVGTSAWLRPAAGGFSFVEHAWHLADLEREGYGVRIARLLTEAEPALADFPGNRIARERRYQDAEPSPALALFAWARRRNLERLRSPDAAALAREGVQEGVGRVALRDLPAMMALHDHGHVEELAALLAEIAPEASVLPRLLERAAAPPPAGGVAPSSRAA